MNSALDLAIYLQVILAELLTGHYNVVFLTRSAILPMANPFKPSPTSVQMQHEFQPTMPEVGLLPNRIASTNLPVSRSGDSLAFLNLLHTGCFFVNASLPLGDLIRDYDLFAPGHGVSKLMSEVCPSGHPILHAMALSDCANIVACFSRGNPRTQDRSSRLIINAIEDDMDTVNVSFCCAPFNIADVGA